MVFLIILFTMLAVDLYAFKGIRMLVLPIKSRLIKRMIFIIFWSTTGLMMLATITGYFFRTTTRNPTIFSWYYYLFGLFLVFYLPKIIFVLFHLVEDIVFAIKLLLKKTLFTKKKKSALQEGGKISRMQFISQTGLVVAAIPFSSFIWGMVKGRFDFRIEKITLGFKNLPSNFKGFKIIHISDIHIGSFQGFQTRVAEAIRMINDQQPDLILFTGDLVNNFYEEMDGWIPVLSRMKSRYGNFASLGNHDYGHYYHWNSETERLDNFNRIKQSYQDFGFKLLNNTTELMEIQSQKIALVGVENWGLPPFPQLGDYDKAIQGYEDIPFKILLSHDPTHWDHRIQNQTDVDLTLSGHTHGMQFGLKLGNIRWSPAQYKFPHWAGLYQQGKQFLYVNRGFGYIGYPGRVGMPPEITVITLETA